MPTEASSPYYGIRWQHHQGAFLMVYSFYLLTLASLLPAPLHHPLGLIVLNVCSPLQGQLHRGSNGINFQHFS